MYCNKCGKEIADDSTFCNYCGYNFVKRKAPPILLVFLVISFIIILFLAYLLVRSSIGIPVISLSKSTPQLTTTPVQPTATISLSPTPSIASYSESVLLLNIYDQNSDLIKTGSGFFYADDSTIVTNFHVINGASSVDAISEDNIRMNVDGVLDYDVDKDIAILKLERPSGLPVLKPSKSKPEVGEEVFAIGSPLGIKNTVSNGIISSLQAGSRHDCIQFTAPISPGSSGGALLNKGGELFGITSASMEEGQNLNLAIPVDSLDKLISENERNDTTSFQTITDQNAIKLAIYRTSDNFSLNFKIANSISNYCDTKISVFDPQAKTLDELFSGLVHGKYDLMIFDIPTNQVSLFENDSLAGVITLHTIGYNSTTIVLSPDPSSKKFKIIKDAIEKMRSHGVLDALIKSN